MEMLGLLESISHYFTNHIKSDIEIFYALIRFEIVTTL